MDEGDGWGSGMFEGVDVSPFIRVVYWIFLDILCHMPSQSISDTTMPEIQKWPVHGLSMFNMAVP